MVFGKVPQQPGGGCTLGISGWGCAAGTLEPLTYTRVIPELVQLNFATLYIVNSLDAPYSWIAVFQKLWRSLAQSSQNKTLYHNS